MSNRKDARRNPLLGPCSPLPLSFLPLSLHSTTVVIIITVVTITFEHSIQQVEPEENKYRSENKRKNYLRITRTGIAKIKRLESCKYEALLENIRENYDIQIDKVNIRE